MFKSFLLGLIYQSVRKLLFNFFKMKSKTNDQEFFALEKAITWGDQKLIQVDQKLGSWAHHFPIPGNIGYRLYDLYFLVL